MNTEHVRLKRDPDRVQWNPRINAPKNRIQTKKPFDKLRARKRRQGMKTILDRDYSESLRHTTEVVN
jgi:hypothetical protein